MGSSISKPLKDLSKEEIANSVASLGESYEAYSDGFIGNGLDGRVLDNLDDKEIQETLDDLEITNRLHRRVLLKELDKAKSSVDFTSTYYNYSPSTEVNDFEPYCHITDRIFRENKETACMAGVHLVLDNGNQLALDTKLAKGGKVVTQPLSLAKGYNICGNLVHDGTSQNYYKLAVPKHVQENLFEDPTPPMTYTGHILKNESGKRVGMVCMMDTCYPSGVQDMDRENFLRRMAIETEYQLNLRRQLIERWRTLTLQLSEHEGDPSAYGQSPTYGIEGALLEKRASHKLPVFQAMANEDERNHLALNFYDLVDELSAPRPPIAKNDIERCAVVEALGLADIAPEDDVALHLVALVKKATETSGFPHGEITVHNHENQFCIAGYDQSNEVSNILKKLHQTFRCNVDGGQFTRKTPRGPAICNYPIASGQTFVVQDISADESFKWLTAIVPLGCYSGTPIKDPSGRVVAVLCLYDSKPRPDFRASEEKQIEEIGRSIGQTINNWVASRSFDRLKHAKNLIGRGRDKSGIPKGNVTMVLTDIQGSTALWESHSVAMQEGQGLHDEIIRNLCAEHLGYEIETEGDSFALAFHDPVDAFAFALKVQTSLCEANWPSELLCQPEAKEDAGAFKGLRVRMAIHHGTVGLCEDLVSERINYRGQTMNLTKTLASMAQGGQILTTTETWEEASDFISSTMDYPQVIDLGCHVLQKGKSTRDGLIAKRLVQLVPSKLARNFHSALSDRVVPSGRISGRRFPPLTSLKKLSPSFYDAPSNDKEVTVAFVESSEYGDREKFFLANLIGILLDGIPELHGYVSADDMLVFQHPVDAVLFGLNLQKQLDELECQADGTNLSIVTYTCIHGSVQTVEPNKTTGRASYEGGIVKLAEGLKNMASPGSVSFGVVSGNDEITSQLDHPSVKFCFNGSKTLENLDLEVSIYECSLIDMPINGIAARMQRFDQ